MDALLSLLSQPVTQLGGIVAIAMALQRYGIDVKGALRAGLGLHGDLPKEIDADNRNAMQTLLSKLENNMNDLFTKQNELKEYYNHTTTDILQQIRDTQQAHGSVLADVADTLKDMSRNGIRLRN